jgi:hypothetical protein
VDSPKGSGEVERKHPASQKASDTSPHKAAITGTLIRAVIVTVV